MPKRISELPAVVTPNDADEFEVNQGGVSKKETRAQILVNQLDILASTVNGEGASLVYIEDVGGYYAAPDLEAALQEIGADQEAVDATFFPIEVITAAQHVPTSGKHYQYAPSGGAVLIILDETFPNQESCYLQFVSGTCRIVPGVGKTVNLSNRVAASKEVTDAVFTGQSGTSVTVTSAGSNVSDYAVADVIVISSHDVEATNNGIMVIPTGGAHATNDVDFTKIANSDGAVPVTNPADASSEAVDMALLDPVNLLGLKWVKRYTNDFLSQGGDDEDEDHLGAQLENGTLGTGMVIPETLILACSDETTSIETGTAKVSFVMPWALTLTDVKATVTTAPTDATLIIDINDGGTSIMTTNKIQIETAETDSDDAATQPVLTDTALAAGALVTVDFDQVGSTEPGKGVKVYLYGTRTLA